MSIHRLSHSSCSVFFGAAVFALGSSACDPTQTIGVTSTSDSGDGSLRAAIQRANGSNAAVTIQLAPGEYVLSSCGKDDNNTAGDLDVTASKPLVLTASGTGAVVIRQTCAGERVLDDHSGAALTLRGVTLSG
ncbi:MAG TPA: hypothetical protein VK524_24915, partial [Polyangiaceae bacterium]|nr:hypothetical protein [Polyangiaceae bacterium]